MRLRIRGKVFHAFDKNMLQRGWKGGLIHEPAGFLMCVVCALAPLFPLVSYHAIKRYTGFDMLEVPATRNREEYNFAGTSHFYEERRGDASDIGFVYEYHYADGTKEYKTDYPMAEIARQENAKRRRMAGETLMQ